MIDVGLSHEGSLLLTLEEISQLVSHSHDPSETLVNIVRLIQRRFNTDVCSVYLLEAERSELVLGATVGLKPESVGRIRMRLGEGLTGLVAETVAPVTVDEAFQHPRFKFFPEAGEDRYHSFLGVPLVEGGSVQGVLVVQTIEPRQFSDNETRMLVTVASQLAPLVSGARLLDRLVAHHDGARNLPGSEKEEPLTALTGRPLSPGTGVGEAYVVDGFEDWLRHREPAGGDLEREKVRLAGAMDAAREEIVRQSHKISALVGADHGAILQAQLMILQDRKIEQDLMDCLAQGQASETALFQTLDKYVAAFGKLDSSFFQERVFDVKDVFRRILWHLRPHGRADASRHLGPHDSAHYDQPPGQIVLVAHEASVMDLFSVDIDHLAGVVVERGGPQSHAAILARSLGVPMVGQLPEFVRRVRPGMQVLVDGTGGAATFDPSADVLAARKSAARARAATFREPALQGKAPAGRPAVEANVNMLSEVPGAMRQQAAGVGLYRTEFLFLARRTLPTEEEQVTIYRKLLERLDGRPVSIRTFDLRPDKLAHEAHLTSSAAGPLDWRLVLESVPLQKLFKDQVRAILRAATAGPARVLVPLITRTEQLDFVVRTVHDARAELRHDGLEFRPKVPLGVMIEVAAATAMVATWAEHVDFFALGTNDLAASALGLDRDDPIGAAQNDALHPGLLRLIYDAVTAAHRAGRTVSVCGEMAADEMGALALAALDVDILSVPVGQVAATYQTLQEVAPESRADLAEHMLRQRTGAAVRALLRQSKAAV